MAGAPRHPGWSVAVRDTATRSPREHPRPCQHVAIVPLDLGTSAMGSPEGRWRPQSRHAQAPGSEPQCQQRGSACQHRPLRHGLADIGRCPLNVVPSPRCLWPLRGVVSSVPGRAWARKAPHLAPSSTLKNPERLWLRTPGASILHPCGMLHSMATRWGEGPPARHGSPLCVQRPAGPGELRRLLVCARGFPVEGVWEAWRPWNAGRADTGQRPQVLGRGTGTRSDPVRDVLTPCMATPSR